MARYIDADKLMESPYKWLDGTVLVIPVEEIDRQPTADVVEVKHGKWLTVGESCEDKENVFACSECGTTLRCNGSLDFDYCHRCGAKMDMEEIPMAKLPDGVKSIVVGKYSFDSGERKGD